MTHGLLICTLFLVLVENISTYGGVNKELELRSMLFNESRYSPLIRPRQNATDSVVISSKWSFIRLTGLSEKEARLSLSISIHLTWTDDYLVWDPVLYGGIASFTATGRQVWTPDFRIFNRMESAFLQYGLEVEKLFVISNGTIQAILVGELHTMCDVNPENFPNDCHACSIVMGISETSKQQVIVWDTEPFENIDSIRNTHALWTVEKVETVPIGPPHLLFNVVLKRLPAHYIYNIVYPAAVLAILSICNFFIPIDEGERVSFGVTIFLSFMVLMLQVTDLLPENSRNISVVGRYFLQLMCSSLVAIINSVAMSYFQDNPTAGKGKQNSIHPADNIYDKKTVHNPVQPDILEKKQLTSTKIDNADVEQATYIRKSSRAFVNWTNNAIWSRKIRMLLKPLRIFDWVTLLFCFITVLYAHIRLFLTIYGDTCPVGY